MQPVFLGERYPQSVEKVLFLASLVLYQHELNSSSLIDAKKLLEQLGYDGVVYIPHVKKENLNAAAFDYEAKVRWINGALIRSDIIIFLLPEDLRSSPPVVMSVELGWMIKSGRVILAASSQAEEEVSDLHLSAQRFSIPYYATLSEALHEAVKRIGFGARRYKGETAIPLDVWRTESFQEWLTAQRKAENWIEDAHVEWIGRIGSKGDMIFFWIIYVKVWVQDESRYKENEWVIGRPDISSILLYLPHPSDLMETKIVLVREYRSPASNSQAKLYELPGGSTFKSGVSPRALAVQELQEETGITLNAGYKLRSHITRQLNGALSMHKCHLFSLELTPREISNIEVAVGKTFGNREDTEQTTLVIMSLRELLHADFADYATLGMIFQALTDNGVLL